MRIAAAPGDACLTCHGDPSLSMTVGTETVPLYVNSSAYSATAHSGVECASCHTGMAQPHDTPGANANLRTYGSWARFSQKNTDVTVSRNFYSVPASACLGCHAEARFAAFADSEHATIKDLKFNADGSPRQEVMVNGVHTNENFDAKDCERCHVGNNCGTCHFKSSVIQKGGAPYPGVDVLDLWTDYSSTADTTKGNRTEWSMDRTSNISSHDFRSAAELTTSNAVCTACHTGYYQGDKSNAAIDTHGSGVRRHPQSQEMALTRQRGVHTTKPFCTDCHTELHDLAVTNTDAGGRLEGNTQCTNCHDKSDALHGGDLTCIACHDAELSLFPGGEGVMRDPGNANKVVVKAIKHNVEENWPSHNLDLEVACSKCHAAGNTAAVGAPVISQAVLDEKAAAVHSQQDAPHGGYSSTTSYCEQCHAVHGGSDYALLWRDSVTATCATCHGLNGSPPTGTRDPAGPGTVGTASTQTVYDVGSPASAHAVGSSGPSGEDVQITESNWEFPSLPNADSTSPAGAGTANALTGGLYCASCHTPHGDFGQAVNTREVWTSSDGTQATTVKVPWAENTTIWWQDLSTREWVQKKLHRGTEGWQVCNGENGSGGCEDAQMLDAEGRAANMYAYKMLSASPNHTYSTVGSYGTDVNARDAMRWCGTCHPSRVDASAGGTANTHPTGCASCHGNPGDGSSSDFPHTSAQAMLLKAYPDAICVTCHVAGSVP